MTEILPNSNVLILADTEHFTHDILYYIQNETQFNVLVPTPSTKKIKQIAKTLEYKRQWAGFAVAQTNYRFNGSKQKYKLIVQRSGEVASNYDYKAFITTENNSMLERITEQYSKRWSIEEFFNFEGKLGWARASTMNLNIRYGRHSLALIAQAAIYQLRKKLPKPYMQWTAEHIANEIFHGIDGDLRVKNDTIIVTLYGVPQRLNLKKHYENLPEKLLAEGIDPHVPWLYNFKLDFRFK